MNRFKKIMQRIQSLALHWRNRSHKVLCKIVMWAEQAELLPAVLDEMDEKDLFWKTHTKIDKAIIFEDLFVDYW